MLIVVKNVIPLTLLKMYTIGMHSNINGMTLLKQHEVVSCHMCSWNPIYNTLFYLTQMMSFTFKEPGSRNRAIHIQGGDRNFCFGGGGKF